MCIVGDIIKVSDPLTSRVSVGALVYFLVPAIFCPIRVFLIAYFAGHITAGEVVARGVGNGQGERQGTGMPTLPFQ